MKTFTHYITDSNENSMFLNECLDLMCINDTINEGLFRWIAGKLKKLFSDHANNVFSAGHNLLKSSTDRNIFSETLKKFGKKEIKTVDDLEKQLDESLKGVSAEVTQTVKLSTYIAYAETHQDEKEEVLKKVNKIKKSNPKLVDKFKEELEKINKQNPPKDADKDKKK